MKEIAHLILEDPVKPVKWHHKKRKKKSLFGSSAAQKQEYEEDDDEDDEDEQKTIEEKLLEEDQEKMIMNVDEMNAADLELMLEDDMDEESDDGEKIEEVQRLLKEAEENKAAQGIVGKVGSISTSGLISPHSNNDEGKEGETVLNDEDLRKKRKDLFFQDYLEREGKRKGKTRKRMVKMKERSKTSAMRPKQMKTMLVMMVVRLVVLILKAAKEVEEVEIAREVEVVEVVEEVQTRKEKEKKRRKRNQKGNLRRVAIKVRKNKIKRLFDSSRVYSIYFWYHFVSFTLQNPLFFNTSYQMFIRIRLF